MPVQNRDYYGAAQRGRNDALDERYTRTRNALGGLELEQAKRFNALATNPNATPEQFARAGRSDVGNSIINAQNSARQGQQLDAQRLFFAAQYGVRSQSPKAFIAENFPELAALNPNFANESDEQIRASLQDLLGRFGAQAGVGPPEAPVQFEEVKGPRGSLLQRDPRTGELKQVVAPAGVGGGTNAPSGYRYNPDGTLSPIAGGPADPNTPNTRDDSRIFAKADKLRDEFNAQSKEFISVGDSYNTVKAAAQDPSAAGDLSMIFAYMKMLDPNSVVREQEFANAQNAAGVPDRIRNTWNKLLEGERLNPDQRKDFINQAKKVYEIRKTRNKALVDRYTAIAKRNKVNPEDVVGDLSVYEGGASSEITASGPNGQKLVLRNGQWVPL